MNRKNTLTSAGGLKKINTVLPTKNDIQQGMELVLNLYYLKI